MTAGPTEHRLVAHLADSVVQHAERLTNNACCKEHGTLFFALAQTFKEVATEHRQRAIRLELASREERMTQEEPEPRNELQGDEPVNGFHRFIQAVMRGLMGTLAVLLAVGVVAASTAIVGLIALAAVKLWEATL